MSNLGDTPEPITSLREFGQRLQLGLAIECALMAQYLYAAHTAIPPEDADADEVALANRWSLLLTSIAIGEMFHVAAVANLIVAAGSQPDFQNADFRGIRLGHRGKWIEHGAAFQLSPFSPATVKRLLQYELEDAPTPPRPTAEVFINYTAQLFDPILSIGRLYRQVGEYLDQHFSTLATDQALFLTETDVGGPTQAEADARPAPSRALGMLRLAPAQDRPGEWRDVVWTLIVQGEGGADNSSADQNERSHVETLAMLISEMASNRPFTRRMTMRTFATNPSVTAFPGVADSAAITEPMAQNLASAGSWTFLLLLQLLSAIWREPGTTSTNAPKSELFSVARSVMLALFSPIAATLVRCPAGTNSGGIYFVGPTFEFPEEVAVALPASWDDAVLAMRATVESIASALSTALDSSGSPSAKTRIANGIETCAVLKQKLDSFAAPGNVAL